MINLLVAIDRSLESSFALRTACMFGTDLNIQPIYAFDRPGRDIAFGAGWARKSWERETSRQAQENIEDLIQAEKSQCPYIHKPVVLTGDPFQEPCDYFWSSKFDLLVVGAPFRGMGPLALCRRFAHVARKEHRPLPLMVVRHLKDIKKIVVLTDGSDLAESALGLMLRIDSFISGQIEVVGTTGSDDNTTSTETLNLERGMAILTEKGVAAAGYSASELGSEGLVAKLKAADLLVNPMHSQDPLHLPYELHEDDIQAVLLYLKG
jgi:hypothetical protein